DLREDHERASRQAIREHARGQDRDERPRREHRGERRGRRGRARALEDEPALGDLLHERADVRDRRRDPERAERRARKWRGHPTPFSTHRASTTVMLSGPPFSLARSIIFDAAVLRSLYRWTISRSSGSST